MRILDRYILREMVSYAGLSLGVFLFILMIPEVLRMSELLAQGDVPLPMVVRLLWSVVPGKLMWVIPVSTLASLLVALSRAAADREVIAMEATGISPLRLLRPTVVFGVVGGLLTLLATAWWGPWGARSLRALQAELAAGRASYEVRAGVFDERFPNSVLYVQDIESTTGRWRGVLLANIADRENPRLTVAESAVAVPEPALNRLLIHLYNGSTHSQQPDQPQRYSVSTLPKTSWRWPCPPHLRVRTHAATPTWGWGRCGKQASRGLNGASPAPTSIAGWRCRWRASSLDWWRCRSACWRSAPAARWASSPLWRRRSSTTWSSSPATAWRAKGSCCRCWAFGWPTSLCCFQP
jgi:hypothetical protein